MGAAISPDEDGVAKDGLVACVAVGLVETLVWLWVAFASAVVFEAETLLEGTVGHSSAGS